MGTIAAVQVRGEEATAVAAEACPRVKAAFSAVERLLNAHDATSEIRRLAPLPEAEILRRCDVSVSNCYAAAFHLMRESGGAFNPRWRGTNTLDLGAIAKGFAADSGGRVLNDAEWIPRLREPTSVCNASPCRRGILSASPSRECLLIDLGGNLKVVRGTWRIGIAGSDEVLSLTNGMACATSAEYYRGKHIRDGRTGNVVSNGVVSVTVVHPTSAMLADGLSTTLFVLGRDEGNRFLKAHFPEATAYWQEMSSR